MTTLTLEDFEALQDNDTSIPVSEKSVLSLQEFERLGGVEDSISGTSDPAYALENRIFDAASKGSPSFFDNIKTSFELGNDQSNFEIMAYSSLTGEYDYYQFVQPIKKEWEARIAANPIEGDNVLSNAIYSVAGMIPAMGKGIYAGAKTGVVAGTVVGAAGLATPIPEEFITAPAAFAVGNTFGSLNYWYQQGAGSLYSELKDLEVDDVIAVPTAHIAGAMYGAVEFSQINKLFPGSDKVMKEIVSNGARQAVGAMVKRYGANWASEVGEEGLQNVIMALAQDLATNLAEKTNKAVGEVFRDALVSGWNGIKESAIPMLLLMAPGTAVDVTRVEAALEKEPKKPDVVKPLEAVTQVAIPQAEQAIDKAVIQEIEEEVVEEPTPEELEAVVPPKELEQEPDVPAPVPAEVQKESISKEPKATAKLKDRLENIKNAEERAIRAVQIKEPLDRIFNFFKKQVKKGVPISDMIEEANKILGFGEDIGLLGDEFKSSEDLIEFVQELDQRRKALQTVIEEAPKKVKKKQSTFLRQRIKDVQKGIRAGFREGQKAGAAKVKSAKEILERRRNLVKGARDLFGLTDAQLKKISGKDIRLMSNFEFKKFLQDLEARAATEVVSRDLKNQIMFQIQDKELQKVNNLRVFMKLPSLDKMTVNQLNEFNQALEEFQKGDEFLSLRKLETVKNTELAGIKTVREAKERLAKKLGVPLEDVSNIPVSPMDKFRFDTGLAQKNPFYKFLVDETNASLLDGEERFLEMEREIDDLTTKARASRDRTTAEKLIPTDEIVFEWLESSTEEEFDPATDRGRTKEAIAKEMTDAEITLASYLQTRFAEFRDYLVQHSTLERYQSNYITHIRRGFLEAWKADGLLTAFKEVFKQYKEDEAIFKILEDDTQNILPLEKFFQFAMRRSGELKPSKNVAKAFKAYTKALIKKQSLDKIVPALDIYTYSLAPKEVTPRGLEMDRRLVKFVREWINNKKGRRTSLGGIMPQNGAIDIGMRTIDGFITMIDLGLNIPVGITVQIGEQVTTFVNLGGKKYSKGLRRMNTKKGKAILRANEGFVGKSPWRDMANTADNIGDKFNTGLFILFDLANVTANKIHLLGSMTEQEWSDGEISLDRKAQLKREIGRFRNVKGAKSIFGSAAFGSALSKYKTWALPIFRTLILEDIPTLTRMISRGDFKSVTKTAEFNELLRATLTTAAIVLAGRGLVDDDDDSFLGKVLQKAYRESMTILGAIDPTVLSSVRLMSFLGDLATSIKQIVLLEEYKTKPGYKGVAKLQRTLTPRAAKQLSGDTGKKKKKVKL